MIHIQDKKDCCGCTACASACPRDCIAMEQDAEGFLFPNVDNERCIDCNLCQTVCPMIHPQSEKRIQYIIGAWSRCNDIRRSSSSGGLFSLLAEKFVEKGGIVVGCAMDVNLQAVHIVCTTKAELPRLRSSKYVQSNLTDTFRQIRQLLREGKQVLFSGTPCQVAGLQKFLRKQYDNLYCIDVLCHGVPSPKLFKEYKEHMERIYGSRANFVNFRCKKKEWKRLYITMLFANGVEYFKSATFDPYMQLFLKNKSQRNACFHCPFTTTHRQGDISLGDFWGIGRILPDIDDNKGISLIIVNSDKGYSLLDNIKDKMKTFDSNMEQAIAGNTVLTKNITGEDERNHFYADYVSNGLETSLALHTHTYSILQEVYIRFMRYCLDIIRKVLHKGY